MKAQQARLKGRPELTLLTRTEHKVFEREQELELLDAALDEAAGGRGRLVVLEAAAGLGKTRLLEAAVAQAGERDMSALSARGTELEREFGFAVVRQLIEPLLLDLGREDRDALFSGAAALAKPLFESEPSTTPPAADPTYPILHGLYWLLANLAGSTPLAVAVDDLQWADPASLRFLSFLLSRLGELPVALMVSLRSEEPTETLVSQITAAPAAIVLRPQPLSREAVAGLVGEVLPREPEPEFADACHAATAGNPFFLHALLRELSVEGVEPNADEALRVRRLGPRAVSRAVLMRLARVPGGTALSRAIAVLGDRVDLSHAAALAGLDERSAAGAADLLVSASILKRTTRLEFVHPIVRQAVYSDLQPHDLGNWHARAASVLEEAGATAERVATQLLATHSSDRASFETLRAAARDARARGAPDAAIRYLTRALAGPSPDEPRGEVLLELGEVEAHTRAPEAIDHLGEALELVRDPGKRANAALVLGRTLAMAGRPHASGATFQRVLGELEGSQRELRLTLESEMLLATRLSISARPRLPADRVADLRREAAPAGTPAERGLLAYLANDALISNDPAGAVSQLAERALGDGRLLAERTADSPIYYAAVLTLLWADSFGAAEAGLDAALTDAAARGSVLAFAMALCWRSDLNYRLGRVADAEADARRSLELARQHGWHFGLPSVSALLADALIERGELDEAAALLEPDDFDRTLPDVGGPVDLWLARRGKLRLLRGQTDDGLADLIAAGKRQEEWGARCPSMIAWRSGAALGHLCRGEADEAIRLAEEEVRLAREFGAPRALGIALRVRGQIDPHDDGIRRLREAADVLERSGAELEHARALTDLGAALRRANRRSEAREPLASGLELARRCGATALAERASEELEATGARSRRLVLGAGEELTPSERRIAQLAAEGHSNREIAQSLFVTQKTVEMHLSNAYRKLDIQSRRQLAECLPGRAGL